MTTTHAQPMFAILLLETAFIPQLMLMTTTNALPTIAIAILEKFTTMLLFVMIIMFALINLAILKLDVCTLMLEQNTAMTTMFAQLMDAQAIKINAFTLLLTVMTTTHALLILAIKFLDANILL
jgi:hypothetical protein